MNAPATHADLVQRAVRWLRREHRCSVAFGEIVTASRETPDAIGWSRGFSYVVECKVSRGDFFRDRRKAHAAHANEGMGGERWYLVPAGLVDVDDVMPWWGLAWAHPRTIEVRRRAERRDRYDARAEARVLMSAFRRALLGSRFDEGRGRWEPYVARVLRERAAKDTAALAAAAVGRLRA